MNTGAVTGLRLVRVLLTAGIALPGLSCGIFEPRAAEDPTQAGSNFQPALDAPTVIANLTNAIAQKDETSYIRCFSDPAAGGRTYVFVPSAEGLAQYGSILSAWTRTDEQNYFRNLHVRSGPTSYSNLQLNEKTPPNVTADSVVYYYDYVFQFEHTDKSFPTVAQGSLIFTVVPDNNGQWAIAHWVDFKTTSAISWSMFKGKFSS